MSSFSITLGQSKKVAEDEELLIRELAAIELRISSAKNGLRLGASTSHVKNRLTMIAGSVNDERSKMKELKNCLEEVNSLYISTEDKISAMDSRQSPDRKRLPGIAELLCAPQIAVASFIFDMLGIGTNKNNFLTDWLQGKIDDSNNAVFDLFHIRAEDKSKFGEASVKLIDELHNSDLDDTNPWKKGADKLKAWNEKNKRPGAEGYFDESGKYHNVKGKPENSKEKKIYKDVKSLKKEVTIASVGTGISGSLWEQADEGTYGIASGSHKVSVGKVEGHAAAYSGLFSYTKDGKKIFTPGVGAEIGIGITAFDDSVKGSLGNEYFDVHGKASVSVGKAEAKASANIGIMDSEGKINPQAKIRLSAEALAAEATGTIGTKIAGADIDATGSVNFGVGAHADIGYADGKLSVDIGASLGVGIGVKLDIDFSGTVNAVADKVNSAWSSIKSLFGG